MAAEPTDNEPVAKTIEIDEVLVTRFTRELGICLPGHCQYGMLRRETTLSNSVYRATVRMTCSVGNSKCIINN